MPRSSAKRPMHRRLWFWLLLAGLVVGGWQVIKFIAILQSTDLPDTNGFTLERHEGRGPNGTHELTDAELARLAPAFAQAFSQANATGYAVISVSAEEAEEFREVTHTREHYHDALNQRYQPAGSYVRFRGVSYLYTFTVN